MINHHIIKLQKQSCKTTFKNNKLGKLNILLCLCVCVFSRNYTYLLFGPKAMHNPSIKLHIKSFHVFKAKNVIVSLIASRKIIIYTNVKSQVKLAINTKPNVQVFFLSTFILFFLLHSNWLSYISISYHKSPHFICCFFSVFFAFSNIVLYCQYLMEIILLYLFKLNIECR